MKQASYLILAILVLLLSACNKRVYIPIKPQHSEVVVVKDTVIELSSNGEMHSNQTCDTTSYLHSRYASSRASISNGRLSHTLIIEPRRDSITLQMHEVHITDSIPYPITTPDNYHKNISSTTHWLIILTVVMQLATLICTIKRQ